MKCASCGTANPAQSRYCRQCGSPLSARPACARCGREFAGSNRFCPHCGARVGQAKPERARTGRPRAVRGGMGVPGKVGIIAAVTAGIVIAAVVISPMFARSVPSAPAGPAVSSSLNLNTGTGDAIVWSAKVQRVAANFNCPCEKCGVIRLDECTCDIPRGSVEVKSYIQELLNQSLSEEQVIEKIGARYGHRI